MTNTGDSPDKMFHVVTGRLLSCYDLLELSNMKPSAILRRFAAQMEFKRQSAQETGRRDDQKMEY
jgi:hypothetical protein